MVIFAINHRWETLILSWDTRKVSERWLHLIWFKR